ncbi:MAG: dihydrofolate reductase family protein [Mycobacteriales bacterium]
MLPDPASLRDLACTAGGHVYVFGGSQIVAALAEVDLIDEYQIFVHPVVLGGGTPFFPPLTDRQAMKLVELRTFDGHVAALRYARLRDAAT